MATSDRPQGHGRQPARSPKVRALSVVLALALVALGCLLVRELVALLRPQAGIRPWAPPLLQALSSLDPTALTIAGVVLSIAGLVFVIWALTPRHKRHLAVPVSHASTWMRPVDLARLTTAAVVRDRGVLKASSQIKRKKVKVWATVLDADEGMQERVEAIVRDSNHAIFGEDVPIEVMLTESENRPLDPIEAKEELL